MHYVQHIMWNMKIGWYPSSPVKVMDCFRPFTLHSDIANVFHFAGTYLECRLNGALSFITPTPDLSSNYK
jgi:hypothetical protein